MTKRKANRLPAPRVEPTDVVVRPSAEPQSPTTGLPAPPGDTFRHYLQQVMRYPRLTPEEEHELAVRYREFGDHEAAYRLVTGNLRLVIHIALEYRRNFLNLLDLIQEGNMGLMQAVKKFDPLRGVPFSGYAAWWIRAYVLKHLLDHWSIVKVGTTNARRKLFFNLKKEKERLERLGIAAGPKLLAERFDTTEKDVADVSRALMARDVSLDAPTGDDSPQQLWETIPLPMTAPDESVAQEELREILREKIASFSRLLGERERFILHKRLLAETPLTLQAIGDQHGITREAARLAEKKVIAKLRDYLRSELDDLSVFEVTDEADRRPESPAAAARRRPSRPRGSRQASRRLAGKTPKR